MNAREGMRRIGLVLSVLGGITGVIIGISDFETVWSSHAKFDRLLALPVMRDVDTAARNLRQEGRKPVTLDMSTARPIPSAQNAPNKSLPTSGQFQPSGRASIKKAPPSYLVDGLVDKTTPKPEDEWTPVVIAYKADESVKGVDPAAEIGVDTRGLDGIMAVNLDKAGAVSSIQLATGEWIRREATARLLLPFCYPVVGFFAPWVVIRILAWVATGFFAPRSSA